MKTKNATVYAAYDTFTGEDLVMGYNEAAIIDYTRELNTGLDVPRYAVSRTSRIAAMFGA